MGSVNAIGKVGWEQLRRLTYLTAVASAVVVATINPGTWHRTVRAALARQIVFGGIGATAFTSRVAFLVGISIVVQMQLWLRKVGQSQLLGPVLVAVIIRELGPLLANMIVIGRSGIAITV